MGAVYYAYDPATPNPTFGDGTPQTIIYTYDAVGNISFVTRPNGLTAIGDALC